MILLIGLCYAELGPMFPISGGVVRYPHLVWGSFASYLTRLDHLDLGGRGAGHRGGGRAAVRHQVRALHHQAHRATGEKTYTLTALGLVVAIILLAVFVVVNYLRGAAVRPDQQRAGVVEAGHRRAGHRDLPDPGARRPPPMGGTGNYTSHGFAPYGSARRSSSPSPPQESPSRSWVSGRASSWPARAATRSATSRWRSSARC